MSVERLILRIGGGVVFIVQIVPKLAIAITARLVYGENYVRLPMKQHG